MQGVGAVKGNGIPTNPNEPAFGKMPLSTTSTKNMIGLFNISATAQRRPRAQEPPRDDCLTRPSS
ncbi:hypothetical protein ANCDUO_02821 [Ancylostoma duodenale]|uniref:Uncharacterized protein n=1 Tax=Ancylostoma duodenale TaxID=51022 RepID=A0A0C2HBK4_9BILA|nr:hypothetical protein ANCDUO_02821 [Ancylostoma duodenale]